MFPFDLNGVNKSAFAKLPAHYLLQA